MAPLQAGQAVLFNLIGERPQKAGRLEPPIPAAALIGHSAHGGRDEGLGDVPAGLGAGLIQGG